MNNTKDCIVCGSVIKQSAKKCPYCKAEQNKISNTSSYKDNRSSRENQGQKKPSVHSRPTAGGNTRRKSSVPAITGIGIVIVVFVLIMVIGIFSYIFSNVMFVPVKEPAHSITVPENMTDVQEEALKEAHKQLEYFDISYNELVETLQWMGYSFDDAIFAAEYCGADWYDEAHKCARYYVECSYFSYTGLIDQLTFDGFTEEEIKYAVENCGADWYEEALECAKSCIEHSGMSYKALKQQLEFEGFTETEISYAIDGCEADWCAEALESAKSYLEYADFSRDELIAQLEYEGFLPEEAQYGADGALNGK
ncbi:MAG: hypothetical protein E7218_00975 [Anaerofustis stercorihominis]|nr:hypothetical protein [Anaerofustis stercorihominis]